MLDKMDNFKKIVSLVTEILKEEKLYELFELITNSKLTIEETGYDSWNGGINLYTISLIVDIRTFLKIKDRIQSVESELLANFSIATRHLQNE